MSSSNGNSYNNDRPSSSAEAEFASDPASGGFFHSDYKRHEDLKQMLDTNKDALKLEAMKRIIGMVAKGRDASDLFPAVVKNVVSKNLEVKKLVYVYLVRYAEEQQDLALLSIATFQRALKDPNQLIRASALRVLSSIRVPMIVPIMMLAIKDCSSDMSPYVRKTAAHAIPKLYSLDPEQKEDLVQLIEKLLSDKTTLVVGSAVMAFEEVCPERIDLVHKNYRKLCNLLVDVDEWGQVVIMNMLTRYARTQFVDPNFGDDGNDPENEQFYDDSDSDDVDDEGKGKVGGKKKKKKAPSLDADHRLLLRQAKPLLQSRNAAVVMGVVQLYHHLAPRSEVLIVAKALIRLLRSHREVQSVVLNSIASISIQRKGMFEPFLQSFFVRTSEPTHIKLLKLEILTTLATEVNIGVVLREFQTYISSSDKVFVAAAIQAIGRCAATIKEVTDTCLAGLVSLLSNRDEAVVAESVVVIKKLLQTQPTEHQEIISQMAKLMDHITVPQARAAILWLLGEYSERVPKIAPDVLRKMAKSFIQEEDMVKMQVLNLAVKLHLTNPSQTTLLCQYVFSLAKYDQNYDLRDRARFLRQFIFPSEGTRLQKHAKKIFLASKPAPVLASRFTDREQFQLGSLSHYIATTSNGYHELPSFPTVAPDSSVRNVEVVPAWSETKTKGKTKPVKKKSFYSESEQSSPEDESSEADSSEEASSDYGEDEDDDEEEDDEVEDEEESSEEVSSEEESESSEEEKKNNSTPDYEQKRNVKKTIVAVSSAEESSQVSSSEESSESEEEVQVQPKKTNRKTSVGKEETSRSVPPSKSNLDLLLDLDDGPSTMTSVLTPSLGGFLTPIIPSQTLYNQPSGAAVERVSPSYVPYKTTELVNKLSSGGISIEYRYTRAPHLYSPKMVSMELLFKNHGPDNVEDVKVDAKELSGGMEMHDFAPISNLAVNSTQTGIIGLDLNDSTQPINFTIRTSSGRGIKVTLKAQVGEMVRAVNMPPTMFASERDKLKGMNEHSATVKTLPGVDSKTLCQKVFEAANVGPIMSTEENIFRFAGETLSSKSLVLISLKHSKQEDSTTISVNCEKMVIGSMLLNEIKASLRL